ncbi:hypothetical protein AB0395_44915 [Streptosporangium sp. NPDC051023]|uniref:hypothetical protein n=1 Tax=Streptosporangium sp. NPDC051023 TaxID=3155410 RepID=UPI003450DAA4
MKIRRLSAALLATALGAAVLSGAASASASASVHQAGASAQSHAFSPLPPDWYWSRRYETMAACRVGFQDAYEHGDFTGLGACRRYEDQYRPLGYYFTIYIP